MTTNHYERMKTLFQEMIDLERTGGGPSTLQTLHAALTHLGRPHLLLPSVVNVVGTKGKGSTSFHLAALLEAMGYRVGLFTSPHLREYNERIRIQQRPIPPDILGSYVLNLHQFLSRRDRHGFRSVFELLTLAAIQIFLDSGVDIAIFEAGLGGRLDATAVFRQDLTVLTPIAYDHSDILGHTLTAILREKMGILKPRQGELVVAPQRSELYPTIERLASFYQIPTYCYGRDFWAHTIQVSKQGTKVQAEGILRGQWTTAQVGKFQGENLLVAGIAAYLLTGHSPPPRVVPHLEGRFQIFRMEKGWIILDGAHNALSLRALRQELEGLFPPPWQVVLGFQRDKLTPSVRAEVRQWPAFFWATTPGGKRGLPPHDLMAVLPDVRWQGSGLVPTVLSNALTSMAPESVLVITGSFYVVGQALAILPFPIGVRNHHQASDTP